MKRSSIKDYWNERGYLIVPQLFEPSRVERLRAICDMILKQWLAESPAPEQDANVPNMAYLTEPRYFRNRREHLTTLLEAIADEKSLAVLEQILDTAPLFHNTQYFFEPLNQSRDGDWHRDQQFGATDEAMERARMSQSIGVHVHIAFLPDDSLEIVPGTQARRDTPEELEIRRGLKGRLKNSEEMPGATRILLDAGDACFFSAWGIHRGRYRTGKLRRTFDVICGSAPADWSTPPPTCFLEPDVLDDLTPGTRRFFERFIYTYKDKWLRREYDY